MKDLRVELRFKNAALMRAIEDQFSHLRQHGYNGNMGLLVKVAKLIDVEYSQLAQYVNLKKSPWKKDGTFRPGARKIAEALGGDPMELFPVSLYSGRFSVPKAAEVESQTFVSLAHKDAMLLPSYEDHEHEVAEAIDKALATLSPREEKILNMRFGRNGYEPMTFEAIGAHFDLCKDRIRQIESKGLRKLRHPSRGIELQAAVEEARRT